MTVEAQAKKLDVSPGDLVEIGERHYEIVPDGGGGVTLEPAVERSVAELRAARGSTGLSREEFSELFRDLPSDGEG